MTTDELKCNLTGFIAAGGCTSLYWLSKIGDPFLIAAMGAAGGVLGAAFARFLLAVVSSFRTRLHAVRQSELDRTPTISFAGSHSVNRSGEDGDDPSVVEPLRAAKQKAG